MCPISSSVLRIFSPSKLTLYIPSFLSTTSNRVLFSKTIKLPTFGALLDLIITKAENSSTNRSTKTSTLPPDSFFPNSLAGITLVSLRMSKSFGFKNEPS